MVVSFAFVAVNTPNPSHPRGLVRPPSCPENSARSREGFGRGGNVPVAMPRIHLAGLCAFHPSPITSAWVAPLLSRHGSSDFRRG